MCIQLLPFAIYGAGLQIEPVKSLTVGEEANLTCTSDIHSQLEWVNKTNGSSVLATSHNSRVDLYIPVVSSYYNGAELACRAVSTCSTSTSEKKITLKVTSKY